MDDDKRTTRVDKNVANLMQSLRPKGKTDQNYQERNRKMYDIPLDISEAVKQLSEEHDCPESQVAALLIWRGLKLVEAGEMDLNEYKVHSESPKKKFNLRISSKDES